jgi:4-carboxymuconolactone decarboxylase
MRVKTKKDDRPAPSRRSRPVRLPGGRRASTKNSRGGVNQPKQGRAPIASKADLNKLQEKLLPAISAAIGVGDLRRLKRYLKGGLARGVPLENLEETILQCYLFAGFPAAIEGLVTLRQVSEEPVVGRVKPEKPSPRIFVKRGEKLCRKVYGQKFNALKRRTLELHPDLWNWMIFEGYGKVLSRPPLTPAQRELCVIACLVVTGWDRQLRSHVHGALNVGCTPKSILASVGMAGRVAGRWPLQWGLGLVREEIAKVAAARANAVVPVSAPISRGPRSRTASSRSRGTMTALRSKSSRPPKTAAGGKGAQSRRGAPRKASRPTPKRPRKSALRKK